MKSDAALENLNKLQKSDSVFDAEFTKFDLNGLSVVSGDLDSEGEVTLGADCNFGDDDISLTTQELIVQCSDPNSAQLESVAHNDFIPVEPAEEPREWGFYPQDIAIKGGTHYAYYQTHDTRGKGSITQWVHAEYMVGSETIHPLFTQWVRGGYFLKVPTKVPTG